MTAVAAVLVGVVTPHQLRITAAERVAVGILAQSQHRQRAALRPGKTRWSAIGPPETRRDRVERIGKIAPPWRRVRTIGGELSARPVPAGERALSVADFLRAHAFEEIVFGVVLTDMVEAQEAPASGT